MNSDTPRDRSEYEAAVAEECRKTFAQHEISDRSDDGREWFLRRRVNGAWDHDMHCRIRVLGSSACGGVGGVGVHGGLLGRQG